uniref:Receptor expression-enhancing protein n=1 Tax=Junco hyemalis TaxID=40217 RepID=A0A8C5JHR3_JUNHY
LFQWLLIFGTLYPAYYSYKAVKSKDIKEYVKWMMYWIIFALFTTAETFTDIFLCWFPFYYELKIAFVAWLLSPYTKGSSLLYRKFVHPTLSSKEKEIDDCLIQAKDRSYDALVHFGKRGLNVAATAAVMAASKVKLQLRAHINISGATDTSSASTASSSPKFLWDSHTVSHCVLKTALAQPACRTLQEGAQSKGSAAELAFLEPIYASSGLHGSSKSVKCPGGITKMLFHWAYDTQHCPSSMFTTGFSPNLVYLPVPGLEESPH